MTEHPILFGTEMVRAILDGRKTQTRRIIKPQPRISYKLDTILADGTAVFNEAFGYDIHKYKCPYGAPGDTLWVRETWAAEPWMNKTKPSELADTEIHYRADLSINESHYMWRPSIFMPRWASRINLLMKNVRVEHVQDITFLDAIAEGMEKSWPEKDFHDLWNKLNAKRGYGWDVNPWVRVIEFEVMK